MLGVFGGLDPLIEVERDRLLVDIEEKVAIRAMAVFPTGIGLFEKIVDELLDRIFQRHDLASGNRVTPCDPRNLDVDEPEICVATPAIRSRIREGDTHMLLSEIQTGKKYQMQTMDSSLLELYQKGEISYDIALSAARDQTLIKHKAG